MGGGTSPGVSYILHFILYQSSIISHQSSIINHQSSMINDQSIVSTHQSSIFSRHAVITFFLTCMQRRGHSLGTVRHHKANPKGVPGVPWARVPGVPVAWAPGAPEGAPMTIQEYHAV